MSTCDRYGHLNALCPIATETMACADGSPTSPARLLRETLAALPTDGNSPFARCRRTHFARLAVIDPARPALASPWLLIGIVFDTCAEEPDGGLDSYLTQLWSVAQAELRAILAACLGFAAVGGANAFVRYLRACRIRTTLPFDGYGAEREADLPTIREALVLQQRFARFAAAHQLVSADTLHRHFGAFLRTALPSAAGS